MTVQYIELREHCMNGYSYDVRTVFLFIKESDRADVGGGAWLCWSLGRVQSSPPPTLPSLNSSTIK
jgi:hypothetical protein